MAEYQSETRDPEGLMLRDVRTARDSSATATLSWNSVKLGNRKAQGATTEVIYRRQGCARCPVHEVDHKQYGSSSHQVTLTGLTPGKAYEARLFSVTRAGDGGSAGVIIPATEGASISEISLSYRSHSYALTTVSASGPEPMPEALCIISHSNGASLFDAQRSYPACVDECRLRQRTSPGRACAWGATKIR